MVIVVGGGVVVAAAVVVVVVVVVAGVVVAVVVSAAAAGVIIFAVGLGFRISYSQLRENDKRSTSPPGGNQVDGLPPALSCSRFLAISTQKILPRSGIDVACTRPGAEQGWHIDKRAPARMHFSQLRKFQLCSIDFWRHSVPVMNDSIESTRIGFRIS